MHVLICENKVLNTIQIRKKCFGLRPAAILLLKRPYIFLNTFGLCQFDRSIMICIAKTVILLKKGQVLEPKNMEEYEQTLLQVSFFLVPFEVFFFFIGGQKV